ncbi:MAG: winged helix-turn-helix domain-containing protein [Candidatus Bathyarchaeota archaeon]|nr:winged helix-turn-helix domain-containing protein [Candidatus Bathyarchaeota archaeon]
MTSVGFPPLKYLFSWLTARNRGTTRIEIIKTLHEMPQNANQIATTLKVDYKTVRHHLGVLEKKRLVTSAGEKYCKTYFLSRIMEDNFLTFMEFQKKHKHSC